MPAFTPISATEIILGLGALLANTYLGLAVLLQNPKSWTNRFFALLALVLDLYILVNPPSLHPPLGTPENQLFWIRMVIVVAAFIGPLLFLLVHTFPRSEITLKKEYLILVLALAFLTAIAAANFYVFESISYPEGKPVAQPGKGIVLFVLDFPVLVILSFVVLIRKYIRAGGAEKVRLSYFVLGIFGTFSLMVISTIILVLIFKTAAGIFLGPIFPVILMASVAYAIIRHQFLDIKPLIARAVSFLIVLVIFAGVYAALLILFLQKVLAVKIEAPIVISFIILTVIVILSFQPLDRALRRLTNRLFFKGRYDRDELLQKLTRIMSETIDLNDLISGITGMLAGEMRIAKLAFLLVDNHRITDLKGFGYHDSPESRQDLEALFHNPFVSDSGRRVIFDNLAEGELKDRLRAYDISIAMPIKVESSEIAIFIIGSKLSGEPYFAEDVELLDIISSEAGIAIQNALAFDRIKKFSKELERRVEERTRELRQTQERELAKAREVAKLKDEFVFIAAHELRTPVTAIRGFLELVEPATKRFPKDVRHHLNAIAMASENLNQLINDLLETARSDFETLKFKPEPVFVSPIIREVIAETDSLANQRSIKIKVKITRESQVLADPGKLKEILINLVSNAIKYNRDYGTVAITTLEHNNKLLFEVRDTGYGIPKEEQGKIFQKFARVIVKETHGILGTGLGLFICRMLVERMGGQISFTSTPGKGTTFAFSLPLVVNLKDKNKHAEGE